MSTSNLSYSARVQLLEFERVKKQNDATVGDMIVTANAVQLKGEHPNTENAMAGFLRDIALSLPRYQRAALQPEVADAMRNGVLE